MEKFIPEVLKNGNPNSISPEAICQSCPHHFIYSTCDIRKCEICINKEEK